MPENQILVALVAAATIGLAATLLILRRIRRTAEREDETSPFAASTEGEKLCPQCGMGNLWTDRQCIACKARLPG